MKKESICFLSLLLVFTFVNSSLSQDFNHSAKEAQPFIAQNIETQKDTLDPNDYKAVDKMPEIISQEKPVFPEEALKKNLEGKVFLRVLVDANGNSAKVEVLKSSNSVFDDAAIKAAKNYKFNPATKDGKSVSVWVVIPFNFALSKDGEKKDVQKECYYDSADEMPSIIGGMSSLFKKLSYPEQAKKKNIEGKVLIKILVDENGNIDATNVIKGIGYGCDEAAEKAARSCKFTPAKKDGKNVKAQVVLPVQFKLK